MNQREAAKVLRQLAKDSEHVIQFVMDPKGTDPNGDVINLLIAVDHMRTMPWDKHWRLRMFEEYYALEMACAKYRELSGDNYSLEAATHRRCIHRGHANRWPILFIKNCISILHEGQIYH